ncbi:hypothetical protein Droror1_Dr00019014 [Drosera rotundifolia]
MDDKKKVSGKEDAILMKKDMLVACEAWDAYNSTSDEDSDDESKDEESFKGSYRVRSVRSFGWCEVRSDLVSSTCPVWLCLLEVVPANSTRSIRLSGESRPSGRLIIRVPRSFGYRGCADPRSDLQGPSDVLSGGEVDRACFRSFAQRSAVAADHRRCQPPLPLCRSSQSPRVSAVAANRSSPSSQGIDYNLGSLLDDIDSNLEDVGLGLSDVPLDRSTLFDLVVLPSSGPLGGGKVYERVKEVLGHDSPPHDLRLPESHSTGRSLGGVIDSPRTDLAYETLSSDGNSSNGKGNEGHTREIPPKELLRRRDARLVANPDPFPSSESTGLVEVVSRLTQERRKGKEKASDTSRRGEKRGANVEPLDSHPSKSLHIDKRAEEAEKDGFNKGIVSGFDELQELCKMLFPNVPTQKLDPKSFSSYPESGE